jgi:hypothetical protein
MWFMVEYGLGVSVTKNIRKWGKGMRGRLQKKDDDETPGTIAGNSRNSTEELQSKKDAKGAVGQSNTEGGSKNQRTRKRKWFRGRDTSKPDEEQGTKKRK